MTELRVACVQNTAGRDIQANVDAVCELIDEAAGGGAQFVALPETVGLIEPVNERIPPATYTEADDIGLAAFRAKARQHATRYEIRRRRVVLDIEAPDLTAEICCIHTVSVTVTRHVEYLDPPRNSAGHPG